MASKNDNLKKRVPFTKNDPRINKEGRPPKLPELDVIGAKLLAEEKNGVTLMEALLRAVANKALKGDVRAAEALLDRFYGKAKQTVDMQTQGEAMNIFTIVPASTLKKSE